MNRSYLFIFIVGMISMAASSFSSANSLRPNAEDGPVFDRCWSEQSCQTYWGEIRNNDLRTCPGYTRYFPNHEAARLNDFTCESSNDVLQGHTHERRPSDRSSDQSSGSTSKDTLIGHIWKEKNV